VVSELFELSIFDPRLYVVAFKLPHIKNAGTRIKFIAVGLVVSVIVTGEKNLGIPWRLSLRG